MTSQKETILGLLRYYSAGVCGTVFLEAHIPRYAARINELRNEGYTINSIPCPHHYHTHRANIATYQLVRTLRHYVRTHTAPDRLVR